ncbi:hypothetical protein GCM10007874_15630 [Labrys miyagiensis]|uniref:ABC transporter permease n=1 Tax=Labrys miyagiensis TaxID=346912 RepID=A0ABQ6CK06_9HYPH|nr:hypothetical protein GCM10007874_15630 [Labrys miyagiensis]
MRHRARLFVEITLAAVFALVFFVTVIWPDWIELVFGADPDQGSGDIEWTIAALTGVIALGCSILARTELRRAQRLREEADNA